MTKLIDVEDYLPVNFHFKSNKSMTKIFKNNNWWNIKSGEINNKGNNHKVNRIALKKYSSISKIGY